MTDQTDQTERTDQTDQGPRGNDRSEETGADDGGRQRNRSRSRGGRSRGSRGGRGRGSGRGQRQPSGGAAAADGDAGEAGGDAGSARDTANGSRPAAADEARGEASSGRSASGDPSSEASGGDDGSTGKRRRRGRRGGRGRGGGGGGGRRAETGKGDGGGPATGERQEGRRDAPNSRETTQDRDTTSDRDAETEDAIAKGGTRVAAKRGGNGSRGGRGAGNGRRQQRTGGVPEEVRRAILEGPPRTMLVTAADEATQIAVLEDRTVVEHYVTRKQDVTYVGNIYMARVQNVLPGMEAAFLDIGKGRNGVLYAGEVLFDELDLEEGADQRIENVLKSGQTVLVQVTKDPMGSKGPRLTMHLSLAGRYSVIAPNSELFGISRKLTDNERDRLRKIVKRVKPDEHGVIVRTAAEGATDEQLTADLERLLAKWAKVEERAKDAKALTAVYEEPPLVVKVIRDNFGPEFVRCTVDDEDLYQQVRGYLEEVAPELLGKVELYGAPTADAQARAAGAPPIEPDAKAEGPDDQEAPAPALTDAELTAARERREKLPPLFDAYGATDQLRKAMGRKVWLPSGGHLIIESTEAMKVIDVNTGKFTGGSDTSLEEVVAKTNLEAADEIVRQLRLRDLGGIIVIDFIDMLLKANQDQVVLRLKRELLRDRTKTRVSEVSKLGLVQMTRKNVSAGLVETFSHTCEHCEGRGHVAEL